MRQQPTVIVLGLTLSAAFSFTCLVLFGSSLALFLSGLFLIIPLLPPLVLTQRTAIARAFVASCVVDGVGIIWLVAVASPQVSFLQWLRCYLILISFTTLVSGLSVSLLRARIATLAASAITVVLSLIWLSAPIWLASNLSITGAARFVEIHPVFAINGVLAHLGAWTHWPIAYRSLTTLGQDIPYTLPTSIWPCAAVHLIPGIALWWVGWWRAGAARASEVSPSSAAARS
jgi:hypothetical protein